MIKASSRGFRLARQPASLELWIPQFRTREGALGAGRCGRAPSQGILISRTSPLLHTILQTTIARLAG
jgi:hypothetical protein